MAKDPELDSRQGHAIIFYRNKASFFDHPTSSPVVDGDAFPAVNLART